MPCDRGLPLTRLPHKLPRKGLSLATSPVGVVRDTRKLAVCGRGFYIALGRNGDMTFTESPRAGLPRRGNSGRSVNSLSAVGAYHFVLGRNGVLTFTKTDFDKVLCWLFWGLMRSCFGFLRLNVSVGATCGRLLISNLLMLSTTLNVCGRRVMQNFRSAFHGSMFWWAVCIV